MITGLRANKKFIKNNRGMVSADFIFSLVLAFSLSIVLFALTFTFSMAEVAQYIVFSSSRAYAAAHVDISKQDEMGRAKFAELLKNSELAPIIGGPKSPWFSLGNLELRGGAQNFNDEYSGYDNRIPFVGARAEFSARLMSLNFPMLGQTDPDGKGFKAKLTSFLIREPTSKECWDQVNARYGAIMSFGRISAWAKGGYVPIEDNGC